MRYLLLAAALVGADQLSKFWARTGLDTPIEVLPGFVFRFAENTGIAFSLPLPQWVIIGLSVVVILWLIYSLLAKPASLLTQLSFVLILTGAVGNLIDRLMFGAVTDFISIYSFPIFNLADSFISIGVVLYLWQEVIGSEQ